MLKFNFTTRDLGYLLIIFSLFVISVSYTYHAFNGINELALGLPGERISADANMFLNMTSFSVQIPNVLLVILILVGLFLILFKDSTKKRPRKR